MPRHPTPIPQTPALPDEAALQAKEQQLRESANAMAEIHQQAQSNAQAIAQQVGYEGTLEVGALEDEIRFYQRQTVEALLETGKRLLVLKELTPHGEFQQRVEGLGFHVKTAQRFMSAATKTAKSDTVSLLSSRVKNAKAFLELVTHDEDTLQAISELDEIDCMSASQLRRAVRELRADADAKDKVMSDLQRKNADLSIQQKKKIAAVTDWPDALEPLSEQVGAAGRKLATAISELTECRQKLFEVAGDLEGDERERFDVAIEHVGTLYNDALECAQTALSKEIKRFDDSLGMYTPASAPRQAMAAGLPPDTPLPNGKALDA